MNLLSKSVISAGAVAAAALLLAVSSPRTVHALGEQLVSITNTAAHPAIVEDVPHMPSHVVTLLGFVASTSYNDPLIQLLPNGTVNYFFSVPAGQSLVITSVDVTPPSSASAWINLYSASGGYYGWLDRAGFQDHRISIVFRNRCAERDHLVRERKHGEHRNNGLRLFEPE